MAVSETNFNRKKVNYLARKRHNDRQRKSKHAPTTIDNKKYRQIKLMERKLKRQEEKGKAKEAKMDTS
jgi:hypothetical protein